MSTSFTSKRSDNTGNVNWINSHFARKKLLRLILITHRTCPKRCVISGQSSFDWLLHMETPLIIAWHNVVGRVPQSIFGSARGSAISLWKVTPFKSHHFVEENQYNIFKPKINWHTIYSSLVEPFLRFCVANFTISHIRVRALSSFDFLQIS